MFQRRELHTLTGGYALDALEGPEREQFERHLRRCLSCTAEVRGLRETAARLAVASAVRPPPGFRHHVLTASGRTRQLSPVPAQRARPHLSRARIPRLIGVVATVSTAAAIVLGILQATNSSQLDQARAHARAVAAVLAGPDARIATGTTSAGGTVTAVVSVRQREMVLTATGLPSLPASRVYELWLIGPDGTRAAGLLPAAQAGRAGPVLASGLVPGDRITITVEPAGGTARPTTPPIAAVALST
jgi:anti-sigma-K factor RskA